MVEPLIDKVERLLGTFYRERNFKPRIEGEQTNTFGCAVFLDSDTFVISITYDRSQEFMSIGLLGKKMSDHPIGHLVAYLEGKPAPYPVTNLEIEASQLKKYADRLLDSKLLLSKEYGKWAVKASRMMWEQNKKQKEAKNRKIDVNKPVSNPQLLAAFRAHEKDQSKQSAYEVARQINQAIFLTPTLDDEVKKTPPDSQGKVTVRKGSIIKFFNCYDADNNCFLPVFTDWGEINKWTDKPVNGLIMTASDLWGFVLSSSYTGIIINPSSLGWTLTKNNITAIKEDF